MIEKIEILQHGECRHLGSYSREEARRLLCIIAYHHEMVIQLRKDSLNSLPEPFVGPSGRCPVLLVEPVRDVKFYVCRFEQVLLHRCTQIPFVAEYGAVAVFPAYILG